MIRKTLVVALLMASCSCYPLRNARIIDGSENEKAVWVCIPEEEEPLNTGGLECARIDRVLGNSPNIDLTQPVDAGVADL